MECKQRYLQLSELLLPLVVSWCRETESGEPHVNICVSPIASLQTCCMPWRQHCISSCCLAVGKGGSLASQLAAAESQAVAAAAAEASKEKGKGKKPAKQMVLLSTSQRRYS